MRMAGVWRSAVGAARLALPVDCPGCDAPDERWCEECRAPWWEEPVRCETSAARLEVLDPPLPAWSITVLEGSAHGTVSAWKDGGRRDLDRDLTAAMRRAAAVVAPALAAACGEVDVVPCPARAAHTRRRGADLPGLLARGAAAGLRDAGVSASPRSLLRPARGRSRGAGDRGRWRGEAPVALAAVRGPMRPVLLVDDVVTTGATLARAAQALQAGPAVPVGALLLAVAPGVHSRQGSALL
ncbi:ComF family protein [Demequina sp. SYSU T00068]|uniref:ComF family protein n=1 Tax=Demequina lignilytica TaxID=3051663 RepID=UPI00262F1EAA|nr:ComF family protein [Demequina sp. SYSU T00068]MDN4490184.1 ComF family protein [Demequina sp. SYSU T00068]